MLTVKNWLLKLFGIQAKAKGSVALVSEPVSFEESIKPYTKLGMSIEIKAKRR